MFISSKICWGRLNNVIKSCWVNVDVRRRVIKTLKQTSSETLTEALRSVKFLVFRWYPLSVKTGAGRKVDSLIIRSKLNIQEPLKLNVLIKMIIKAAFLHFSVLKFPCWVFLQAADFTETCLNLRCLNNWNTLTSSWNDLRGNCCEHFETEL